MSDDLFCFNVVNNHHTVKEFDTLLSLLECLRSLLILCLFPDQGDDTASYP